jgi:hypothetical protein
MSSFSLSSSWSVISLMFFIAGAQGRLALHHRILSKNLRIPVELLRKRSATVAVAPVARPRLELYPIVNEAGTPGRGSRTTEKSKTDWRDFETKQDSGWQLYDLEKDIGEKNNLAKAEPQIVAELSAAWEKWNKRNIAPLWHGGQTEDPTAPNPKEKP